MHIVGALAGRVVRIFAIYALTLCVVFAESWLSRLEMCGRRLYFTRNFALNVVELPRERSVRGEVGAARTLPFDCWESTSELSR